MQKILGTGTCLVELALVTMRGFPLAARIQFAFPKALCTISFVKLLHDRQYSAAFESNRQEASLNVSLIKVFNGETA